MKLQSYKNHIKHSIDHQEAIIFDIDGVLVNVDKSYDLAIIRTVQTILKDNFGISLNNDLPFNSLISRLRHTGGFNNDIDTTYAIILIFLYGILINKMSAEKTVDFFYQVVEKLDDNGIISLEKELEREKDIKIIKEKIKYSGTDDIISSIFNELFYGPELYRQQFNRDPKYYFDSPLIKNDIIIINTETIEYLHKKFKGHLGVISGRSKVASYFTLDRYIRYFNKKACIFLEDEKREVSKPNTYSLKKVMSELKVDTAIYVGDSVADLLMVKYYNKERKDKKILFCGVYGTGSDQETEIRKDTIINIAGKSHLQSNKKKIFESMNADMIIKNVNDLPNILNNTVK